MNSQCKKTTDRYVCKIDNVFGSLKMKFSDDLNVYFLKRLKCQLRLLVDKGTGLVLWRSEYTCIPSNTVVCLYLNTAN